MLLEVSVSCSKELKELRMLITTFDNPYHPIEEFDKWYAFDLNHGYDTLGYIARLADFSLNDSEEVHDYKEEKAMNQILENDFLALYYKMNDDDPIDLNKVKMYEESQKKLIEESNNTKENKEEK